MAPWRTIASSGSVCRSRRPGPRPSGATRRARSKTSATRRCSCPTTSARSSRRCPRSRWRPRTRRRCASARSCSTTTTSTRRSSPRKRRRSTCSRDGRLELGIGAGWMKTDYDALGLPYDPPAVRVDRFEEALHVIKECFTGEQFSVHGRALPHHRLRVVPEAGAEAGPADPRSAAAASACCRSRRAKPTSSASTRTCARARSDADAARDSLKEQTDRKIQWVRDAAGDALGRHRDPDALLRRKRHRRPHGAGRGARARVRCRARRGARVGRRARRQRERDHRAAAPPPRGVGPVLRRRRRRQRRRVRARSSPSSPAPRRGRSRYAKCAGIHSDEPLAELVRGLREQVAGAGEQHDLAVAGEHLHDAARLGRQDLVVGAVQQQQRRVAELGRRPRSRPTASRA